MILLTATYEKFPSERVSVADEAIVIRRYDNQKRVLCVGLVAGFRMVVELTPSGTRLRSVEVASIDETVYSTEKDA